MGMRRISRRECQTSMARELPKRARESASLARLYQGLPSEFEELFRYQVEWTPRNGLTTARCIQAFRDVAVDHGFPEDDRYVWPPTAKVRGLARQYATFGC